MKKMSEEEKREKGRQRCRAYYEKNSVVLLAKVNARYATDEVFRAQKIAKQSLFYQSLREEMFKAYGDTCACCGEAEKTFLCLDHIGGGGNKDRDLCGGRNTGVMRRLSKLGWPRDGHRVLCANCNAATMRGRICPHQTRKELRYA